MKPSIFFSSLIIISISSFSCCKSSKKTADNKEQIQNDSGKSASTTNNMNAAGELIMPLKIQFFSTGQGIDYKMKESFIGWVKNYAVPQGKTLDYQEKYWGREGETDICFELKNWEPASKATFIAEAKKFVSGSKLVHVFENESCVKGK